jgi:hypothetical protein
MMCDISHDLVGNNDYFKKLAQSLNKETGEAFFMWLTERYEATKNFDAGEIPLTQAKKEMKQRHLGAVLEYIKTRHIATKTDLMDKSHKNKMILLPELKELINFDYNQKFTNQSLHLKLQCDIPIIKFFTDSHTRKMYIQPISYNDLLEFFKKKGFWSDEFDAYTDDEDSTQLNEDLDDNKTSTTHSKSEYDILVEANKQLLDTNNKLMEQMMKMNELFQQLQQVVPQELQQTKPKGKINIIDEVEEQVEQEEILDDDEFDNFFNQSQTHLRKFGK